VKSNAGKRSLRYPYSKNRVYVSFVIFVLSLVLVAMLLQDDPFVMLYYVVSTIILTFATFLLKTRLYPLITEQPTREQPRKNEGDKTSWRVLLLAFFIVVASFVIPLLLALILNPAIWFILILGFTSGVSISEIIFYLQT
jgi:hypothetical protein